MNNKNLNFRYAFYLVFSFLLVVVLINILKEREFQNSLLSYKTQIQKDYFTYFNKYKDIAELIYFNEFRKDDKLLKTYKNNSNLVLLERELKSNLGDSFLIYETLGLKEINFYTKNNELILSMKDNVKDNFTSKIVGEIIKNKQELTNYKIENNKIFILFSKPIFDEKLQFLGVINLEFDMDSILKDMAKNSNFEFKSLVSNNFYLKEKIFFNMIKTQKDELITSINNQKEVELVLNNELVKIPMIFLPVFNSKFYKNSIYLQAYNENKNNELTKKNKYFDSLFVLAILILLLILFLLYKTASFRREKEIVSNKYQEIYEQVDSYIMKVETDLEGKITFATKSFCKLSGYSKEELIGKNISILRHADVSKIFFENMWKDLKANSIWEGEIKNKDKFGNSFWVKAVIFPKYDLDEKVEGYGSIRFNITDTKQLEKINRLLKEDLSNKLNDIKIKDKTLIDATKVELMSKILDSFSQQWKVPITKISFELQKLRRLHINKNLEEIEKNIESELKNLSDMLNEVRYLFNTRNSKKTNLLSLVGESIFSLKDELKTQNIKVKFDIKPDINIAISYAELKNIIVNMIKNSIELSTLNKVENTTIFISAISEELDEKNDVVLKIEDNIKGEDKKIIIDEILSSNEERYFDTHLYLSKLFIEKNKGLFWCNNTIYNTTYFIKLHKDE